MSQSWDSNSRLSHTVVRNTANAHTEGENEYTLNVTQTNEDNTSLWFSN